MSVHENSRNWNLSIPHRYGNTPSPLPYKLVSGPTFNFTDEDASATQVLIIEASRLEDFVLESFPPLQEVTGGLIIPPKRHLPGFTSLLTESIAVDGLSGDSKPVDPFGAHTDITNYDKTFEKFLRLTVNYKTDTQNSGTPDPNDPKTFLEISANASGEFITMAASGDGKWEGDDGSDEDVTEREIPHSVPQPEVEWSVRWSQIPWNFFNGTLMATLRAKLGTVNTETMTLLYSAPQDTVLFIGYTISQQLTWRPGNAGQPPVVIEFKFLEKNFVAADGTNVTHQHFFRPGVGFRRLKVDGDNLAFTRSNLSDIFALS